MSDELSTARRQVHALIGLNGVSLPVVNKDGVKIVVVALGEEPLPVLIDRVRQAGGYANVFVKTQDFIIQFGVVEVESVSRENIEPLRIYQDNSATIDTFIHFLTRADSPVGIELIPGTSSLKASETKVISAA